MKIKEGGVMDIQKEREAFENHLKKMGKTDNETFSKNEDDSYQMDIIHFGWKIWQTAKAQTVPEWAVIVPRLSANYLFNKVPELGFKHQDEKDTVLYHLNYMASGFKESAKQFVEDNHAKQKAMIEAQEQK